MNPIPLSIQSIPISLLGAASMLPLWAESRRTPYAILHQICIEIGATGLVGASIVFLGLSAMLLIKSNGQLSTRLIGLTVLITCSIPTSFLAFALIGRAVAVLL